MRQSLTPKLLFLNFTTAPLRRWGLLVAIVLLILGMFVFWVIAQSPLVPKPEMMVRAQAPSDVQANLPIDTSNKVTAEDYAVYSAALSYRRYREKSAYLVLIEDKTFSYDYDELALKRLVSEVREVSDDTIKDFRMRNKEVRRLENHFKLALDTLIINGDEFDEMMERDLFDGWRVMDATYPNSIGVVSFSNIGFNRERTQAIVLASHGCGPKCADLSIFLLTKQKGVWSVQSKVGIFAA